MNNYFSNNEALEWNELSAEEFPELPVDICIDDMNICEMNHHNLKFLYFRNSYNKHLNEFCPLTISEHPKSLSNKRLNIFKSDYYDLCNFVSKYRDYLKCISEKKLSYDVMYKLASTLRNHKVFNYVNESLEQNDYSCKLYEMPSISKDLTGLNYKVWIDSGGTYKLGGHDCRIKVETTVHDINTHKWNTLRLSDYEFIGKDSEKYKSDDKQAIKTWAFANSDLIRQVSDKEITYGEFAARQKPVYKNADGCWDVIEPIPDDKFKILYPIFEPELDMNVVQTEDKKHFNILTGDGELLSDTWFTNITPATLTDKNGTYVLCYDENAAYMLYSNGYLLLINRFNEY